MAYKSDAQRKKFKELVKSGKMDQSVVDKLDKASEGIKLPERIKPKAKRPATAAELRKLFKDKYGR